MTLLWAGVLAVAVFAAHWGAEQLATPLKNLRRQWGLTAAAGGALVGLASASPDIGINSASAITGAGGIGLGNMLGSNVVSVPGMVIVAYLATRKRRLSDASDSTKSAAHGKHVEQQVLGLDRKAVTVQALPYLAIVLLAAVLILPAPIRGLQPIDGIVMVVAYGAYLAQALLRGRADGESVEWAGKDIALAIGGLVVLAISAYFITTSTERLAAAAGISDVVAGTFLTATMTALPAWFTTWAVARSGQVISAATTTIADNTVAITVGFLPLALIDLPVEDPVFVTVTFGFVALMPVLYAVFAHSGESHVLERWQVATMGAAYVLFVISAAAVLTLGR